ncbi:MAG TPA: ATP synthase F1 subunit gamma [Symbiobacteriaceae bacterium]|nr:ATP synthase F1 subunit gamma [Symbiobacteriaceae bacterium]
MAENKKAVLRRIKAVKSTQQITKAMKMVSAAKLRRAQERVLAARPYARELAKTLARLVQGGAGANHPLLAQRSGTPTVAYVVMTADRGLAGSFNVNIIRKAQATMKADPRPLKLVAIGRKGRDFFKKRGISPVVEFTGFGEDPSFALARHMLSQVTALYLNGEVDEVRIIYTEFVNPVTQRPREIQLLPVVAPEGEQTEGPTTEYIYVPDAEVVLNNLVPRFAETMFYQALLESKASEHGARMTAMGNATDNAKEIIGKLTLAFNRARQASITREISEIVGGAAALEG